MYSRWFNVAVVMLWLSAMGWLVTQKVLPPLLMGEPPSYRTILQAQRREPSVGWTMAFGGRQVGWALSTTSRLPDRVTEIRSRVHFDELPLQELAPEWLGLLISPMDQPVGTLQMDAESVTIIDSLDRLSGFSSIVRIDPVQEVFRMLGTMDGDRLKLEIQSGTLSYETEVYPPQNALLDDALSPQTQLPGLHSGQTWTVPAYSPLRPPRQPLEILQATVEGTEPIVRNGRTENVWLVVYRSDPGVGLGSDESPRAKLWVRRDGTVLKQQVMIFNSTMTFVRLPDQQAAALKRKVIHGQ